MSEKKPVLKLTNRQEQLLYDVARFRFIYAQGLASLYGRAQPASTHARLEDLRRLGVVGRRYEPRDRLGNRHAAYYVTKQALPYLKTTMLSERVLKRAYVSATASDGFMQHSFRVLDTFTALRRLYGEVMSIDSAAELGEDARERLVSLPDLWGCRESDDGAYIDWECDIQFFDDATPLGIHTKQLWWYARCEDDREMVPEEPVVLLVCESDAMRDGVARRVRTMMRRSYLTTLFYVTTLQALQSANGVDDAIWVRIEEREFVSLPSIIANDFELSEEL